MLTNVQIRNAKSARKQYIIADERGLFLLVSPSGGRWWRSMTPWALPAGNMVDIWEIRLEVGAESERLLSRHINAEERGAADRYRFGHLRRRFMARRAAYRQILSRYVDADPATLEFETNAFGKPKLSHISIEHSTSHSGELALLAVAANRCVGVDVEAVRDFGDNFEWLSSQERSLIAALPPVRRPAESLRLWTRKEALAKAQGIGLSMLGPDMAPRTEAMNNEGDSRSAGAWAIVDIGPYAHHVASLAVYGAAPVLIRRQWDPVAAH